MIRKLMLQVLLMTGIVLSFTLQTEDSTKDSTVYGNITVAELGARLEKGDKLFLLDVRTPEEFTGPLGHIEGAILIPVQELETRISELDSLKNKEIIVYCRSGHRSRIASEILSAHDFRATNLVGGMKAWNAMSAKRSQPSLKKK